MHCTSEHPLARALIGNERLMAEEGKTIGLVAVAIPIAAVGLLHPMDGMGVIP